jgi:hypothetical protein
VPLPNVGPSLAPAGFANATLESVIGAIGIGRGRFLLAEQVAQVEEVLLGGAPLGEFGSLPLGDEFLRRHGAYFVWHFAVCAVCMPKDSTPRQRCPLATHKSAFYDDVLNFIDQGLVVFRRWRSRKCGECSMSVDEKIAA